MHFMGYKHPCSCLWPILLIPFFWSEHKLRSTKNSFSVSDLKTNNEINCFIFWFEYYMNNWYMESVASRPHWNLFCCHGYNQNSPFKNSTLNTKKVIHWWRAYSAKCELLWQNLIISWPYQVFQTFTSTIIYIYLLYIFFKSLQKFWFWSSHHP